MAVDFPTKVYLDISKPNGEIVGGLDAFVAPPDDMGPFIQGQSVPFEIYPVKAIAPTELNPTPGYELVSLSGINFEMVMGPRAGVGTVGLCSLDGGSWVATDGTHWVGTLDLYTAAMTAAIGTSDSFATFLEFRISQDGGSTYKPVAQVQVTVVASVRDTSAAAAPVAADPSYITVNQAKALFVQWNNMLDANNYGRSIVLASPSGLKGRGFGVDDDGSPVDYVI